MGERDRRRTSNARALCCETRKSKEQQQIALASMSSRAKRASAVARNDRGPSLRSDDNQ